MMRLKTALTLVEVMVAMSIVSLLSVGALFSFSTMRQNHALKLSGDMLVNQLQKAHIFSRESRDEKSWGIKILNDQSYAFVSRDGTGEFMVYTYTLTSPTKFTGGAGQIWFDLVTGYTESDTGIQISSPRGEIRNVTVSQNGVVKQQ